MTLPITVRSGMHAGRAPGRRRGATRKPVMTSSKTSSAPVARRALAQQLEEALGRAGRGPCWPGRARPGSRRARAPRARARDRLGVVPRHDDGRRGGGRGHARAGAGCPAWPGPSPPRRAGRRRGRGRRRRTSAASRGPVAARASRIALIDASVPDEVMRSISTDGIRRGDLLGQLDLARGRRAERRARARPPRRPPRGPRDGRGRGSAGPTSRRSRRSGCRRRR